MGVHFAVITSKRKILFHGNYDSKSFVQWCILLVKLSPKGCTKFSSRTQKLFLFCLVSLFLQTGKPRSVTFMNHKNTKALGMVKSAFSAFLQKQKREDNRLCTYNLIESRINVYTK